MPVPGPLCSYCPDVHAELVDAGEVYGEKYQGQFNLWLCRGCGAYVGAAKDGPPTPLGTLADAETRRLRNRLRDAIRAELVKLKRVPRRGSAAERKATYNSLHTTIHAVSRMQAEECRSRLMAIVSADEELFTKED